MIAGIGTACLGGVASNPPPKIDVLIPAYNAERTVAASIRSIQDQTVRAIRIIVVDDGSTDRTAALLHEAAAEDPRVTVIDSVNGGIVAALNLALARSTAAIIARHDADDIAFPDRFARQLAYLDEHPDCIAVGSDAFKIDAGGRRIGRTHFAGAVQPDATALPAFEPYLLHPFLMIRGDALRAAGGYRHVLHAEDTDLYWRLLTHGRLHSLPDLLGEYRIHGESVSSVSIARGRVAAAYAELAAVSFRRVAAGAADLDFPAGALTRMERLLDIEAVVADASRQLTAQERDHFRPAVAAKLLQNATFRPYLLETDDCRFIAAALPTLRERQTFAQRRRLSRMLSFVVWKLLRHGRIAAARALHAPTGAYLQIGPMLALRAYRATRERLG